MAVLLALLAGGCTGGDGGKEPDDGASREDGGPRLEREWKISVSGQVRSVWRVGGTFVMESRKDGLRGFDADTGKRRWTLELPPGADGICEMSVRPDNGMLGAVFGEKTDEGIHACKTVGAVEVTSGRLLWRKRVADDSLGAVSIGGGVVTTDLFEGGVRRYNAADGDALPGLRDAGKPAHNRSFHDGSHVVVGQQRGGFTVHDAESGKRLWESGRGIEVHRLVASVPLTLDVTDGGQRQVNVYDAESAERLGTFAPNQPLRTYRNVSGSPVTGDTTQLIDTPRGRGGVLVTGYAEGDQQTAYDISGAPGKPLWRGSQKKAVPFHVNAGGILASTTVRGERPVPALDGPEPGRRLLLIRWGQKGAHKPADWGVVPKLDENNARELGAVPLLFSDSTVYVMHLQAVTGDRQGKSIGRVAAYRAPS